MIDDRDLVTGLAKIVVVAFALGVLAAFALPWLWNWVRPLIHALTA